MENLIISTRLYDVLFDRSYDIKFKDGEQVVQCEAVLERPEIQKNERGDIIFEHLKPPKMGNYFDIRGGQISFHSKPDNQSFNENGTWIKEGRQICKVSKLVNYLTENLRLNTNLKRNRDINRNKLKTRFVELCASALSVNNLNRIKVSNDVEYVYEKENSNIESLGQLGTSCMLPDSDNRCAAQASMYDEADTKIAYIEDNWGNLVARALLWEGCIDENGNKFNLMDRIYANEQLIQDFIAWADENGYAHKANQDSGSTIIKFPDGNKIEMYLYPCPGSFYFDPEHVPYMDTLYRYDSYSNRFVTGHYSYTHICQECEGTLEENPPDEEIACCDQCGEQINLEIDPFDEINGIIYCTDCIIYSEYQREPLLRSEAVFCKCIQDYVHEDCVIRSDFLNDFIPDDEAVYLEDIQDYIHQDDEHFYCPGDEKYYLNEPVEENVKL